MNAYVLTSILPRDVCIHINYFLANLCAQTIINQYYLNTKIKDAITWYFIRLESYTYHIPFSYPQYAIVDKSKFITVLKYAYRYIGHTDDSDFWLKVCLKCLSTVHNTTNNLTVEEKDTIFEYVQYLLRKFEVVSM